MLGQNSIINAELDQDHIFLAKKQTKEIYKDMSRAEMEILNRKMKEKNKFEFNKDALMSKKSKKAAER